jgi:hypothetical protein
MICGLLANAASLGMEQFSEIDGVTSGVVQLSEHVALCIHTRDCLYRPVGSAVVAEAQRDLVHEITRARGRSESSGGHLTLLR